MGAEIVGIASGPLVMALNIIQLALMLTIVALAFLMVTRGEGPGVLI